MRNLKETEKILMIFKQLISLILFSAEVTETEKRLRQTPYDGAGRCLGVAEDSEGFIGECSGTGQDCLMSSYSFDCEVSEVCCYKASQTLSRESDSR